MLSAFAIAVIGIVYVRKAHSDTLRRREIRRKLLKQVESLPLPRMMKALGIGRFFHQLPLDTIEEAITHCETCTTREECARKLKMPELNPEDVEFCKNQHHLKQFSRAYRINKQKQQ